MSDDFPKDAANHEMPSEDAGTHQIHDRLLALGAQWRDRSVPIDRLSAHLRSLVASEHLNETSNDYPLQEEFVLMNTPITQTQQTSSTRRYLIPAIAAALVIALLGTTFFILGAGKGSTTHLPGPTATTGITTTGVVSPTSTSTGTSSTATPVLPVGTSPLTHVQMIDSTTGWAADVNRVYRTTDAGQTWHNVTPAGVVVASANGPAEFVFTALDTVTAWFSNGLKIYRTTDSGQSWQSTSPPVAGTIGYLTFIDAQHGWAVDNLGTTAGQEHQNLLRSTDGGVSWTQVASTEKSGGYSATTDLKPPVFASATTGWIGGYYPADNAIYLEVTHDGGVTWQPQSLPRPMSQTFQAPMTGITFFDARNGALSLNVIQMSTNTSTEYYYVTHDGGASWSIAGAPQPATFAAPDFLDASHWWVIGGQNYNNLAMTGDGGQHWTTITPGGAFNSLNALDFVSATTGWAYDTSSPLLLQTTDGGHTWQKITFRIG
ncbi:MAG TPA: hypothetical protein VKB76_09115 [Ktedonobacterales bacterium]|nr:hypothetical protein [Ktedonobacterales bacterium]